MLIRGGDTVCRFDEYAWVSVDVFVVGYWGEGVRLWGGGELGLNGLGDVCVYRVLVAGGWGGRYIYVWDGEISLCGLELLCV